LVLLPLSLALLRVLLEAAALVRPVALLDSTEADLGCADAECVLPLAGLFSFEDIASSESSCSSSAHVEKTHTHTPLKQDYALLFWKGRPDRSA